MIAIQGELRESKALWLHGRHLTIHRATAVADGGMGSAVALAVQVHGDDSLELSSGSTMAPGGWTLELDYSGEIEELETSGAFKQSVGGTPYIYTQFQATYARRVFPCFDEPDVKVPWQLTLDVPAGVKAVSNTALQRTLPLDVGGTRFEFKPSPPLPSYLVAFGVGPFDIVDGPPTRSGIPVRAITPAGRGQDAGYAVSSLAGMVSLLEEWFGIPYPYDKLDLLAVPLTLGFSAMENAGLITFSEELSLIEPTSLSLEKRNAWVLAAAHELAHQWFGNFVTMTWWDDIWLNEGFATWMETKLASRYKPTWGDELSEIDTIQRALEADRVTSARQIREPIRTADDIFNAFGPITYDKGAAILNMFERHVGVSAFRRGVQAYLRAHALGSATSSDFLVQLSSVVGKDLAPAFATFIDQPGAPELHADLDCSRSPAVLRLRQRPYVSQRSSTRTRAARRWILPVCSVYDRDGERAQACTLLDSESASLPLGAGGCPRWLMPNAGGRGYYRHRYSGAAAVALRDVGWAKLTQPERRSVFFDITQALRAMDAGDRSNPSDDALPLAVSLIDDMLAAGDRFTVGDVIAFAASLGRYAPEDLLPSYEAWIRNAFTAAAHRLGVLPRPGDDLDAEVNRKRLMEIVGWLGRDPILVQEAIRLARRWQELPQAVRGTILSLAVDADPELSATIEYNVKSEPDRARRGEMLLALGRQRDPERLSSALRLLLDPAFDFREAVELLSAPSTPATRRVAQSFFRAHEALLMQRLPYDGTSSNVTLLVHLFTDTCDAAQRDAVASYTSGHFSQVPGGRTTVEQAVEAMDQCISARAVRAHQVREWLEARARGEHASSIAP